MVNSSIEKWEKRKQAFLDEYKSLIEKHGVDFFSYPVFMPNEKGVFEVRVNTELMDRMGVPSDIIVK